MICSSIRFKEVEPFPFTAIIFACFDHDSSKAILSHWISISICPVPNDSCPSWDFLVINCPFNLLRMIIFRRNFRDLLGLFKMIPIKCFWSNSRFFISSILNTRVISMIRENVTISRRSIVSYLNDLIDLSPNCLSFLKPLSWLTSISVILSVSCTTVIFLFKNILNIFDFRFKELLILINNVSLKLIFSLFSNNHSHHESCSNTPSYE